MNDRPKPSKRKNKEIYVKSIFLNVEFKSQMQHFIINLLSHILADSVDCYL